MTKCSLLPERAEATIALTWPLALACSGEQQVLADHNGEELVFSGSPALNEATILKRSPDFSLRTARQAHPTRNDSCDLLLTCMVALQSHTCRPVAVSAVDRSGSRQR